MVDSNNCNSSKYKRQYLKFSSFSDPKLCVNSNVETDIGKFHRNSSDSLELVVDGAINESGRMARKYSPKFH